MLNNITHYRHQGNLYDMDLEYQDLDPIKAYRNYYKYDKKHLLKYTKREIPEWLLD